MGSLVATWPLGVHLVGAVPIDPGDPLLASWLVSWGVEGLFTDPLGLFDAPIFYPHELTYAFTENLLGLAVPLSPVWFLTRNAELMSNLGVILSFTLNGFTAYLLARAVGASRTGSFIAGTVFAYAPYRIAQLSHLQVEASFYIPLILLCLYKLATESRFRWGILAGLSLALQVWTSLNVGTIAALAFALSMPAVFLLNRRRGSGGPTPREVPVLGSERVSMPLPADVEISVSRASPEGAPRMALSIAAGLVLAALLVLPLIGVFLEARDRYGIAWQEGELEQYSADIASFATAPPSSRLMGRASASLRQGAWNERTLYVGLAVFVFAAIGAYRLRRNRALLLWATTFLVGGVVIAFGPSARGVTLPWGWALKVFPFLENLRVPARAWLLVLIALGGLSAAAFPLKKRVWVPLAIVMAIEFAAFPIPLALVPDIPQAYRYFDRNDGVILELPALDTYILEDGKIGFTIEGVLDEAAAMYRQTSHWRPVVNGFSSFLPERYLRLMDSVQTFPDPRSLDALERAGVRFVVIHPLELEQTDWAGLPDKLGGFNTPVRTPSMIVIDLEES